MWGWFLANVRRPRRCRVDRRVRESGYYYYVTESNRDSKGNTATRQVRRTRWEPSAGRVERRDAGQGVAEARQRAVDAAPFFQSGDRLARISHAPRA